MAGDPSRRADLVQWEHLADHLVAAVHPCSTAEDPPFRLWFDGDRLHLAGCVDTFSADRLGTVLAGTPNEGPVVVLDLGELEFIDAAGTRVIARWVERQYAAATVVQLVRAPRYFQRVWQLLGFDQTPAAQGTTVRLTSWL